MSRADGVLVVTLTHKWFDMIESGVKKEEYRSHQPDGTKYRMWYWRLCEDLMLHPWNERQRFVKYHTLRAQRAYSGVWLERKIKGIRWGAPNPEWCGSDMGDCFIIELEDKP